MLCSASALSTWTSSGCPKTTENPTLQEFSDSVSIGNKKYFDSLTHCLTLFNNVLSLIAGNTVQLYGCTGIVTATSYKGDGSALTGVGGEFDITSCLFI